MPKANFTPPGSTRSAIRVGRERRAGRVAKRRGDPTNMKVKHRKQRSRDRRIRTSEKLVGMLREASALLAGAESASTSLCNTAKWDVQTGKLRERIDAL
jgi:hypothetical protein